MTENGLNCVLYFRTISRELWSCLLEQFHVLNECSNKFDCLINEFIRRLKPSLNVQTDSVLAKVFT